MKGRRGRVGGRVTVEGYLESGEGRVRGRVRDRVEG